MKLSLYLIFLISFSSAIQAAPYNKKINMPESWRKINLIYFHDFTSQNYWSTPIPADCFFMFNSSAATGFKPVLRCIEHVSLLRSDATVTHWQREQNRHGFFMFNLPDTGIHHVRARIKSILPPVFSLNGNVLISKRNSTVIGVFKRHSSNVKSWLFKTLSTGRLSTIHATPTHRFYVKYLNAWLPLSEITSGMTLIDRQNNAVSLVCYVRNKHCGIPWHPGRVATIYNLEVYKKHDYFAGEQMLLVHNCGGSVRKTTVEIQASDAHSMEAALVRNKNESVFKRASNKIISVLTNESGVKYDGMREFFDATGRAVEVYNDEMIDAGLSHMQMKFAHDLEMDRNGCRRYNSLIFSLHDQSDISVEAPFTGVKITTLPSGEEVIYSSEQNIFTREYPLVKRSFIDVGETNLLGLPDKRYKTCHVALIDKLPSDPDNGPRRVTPDLFEAVFLEHLHK